MGQGPKLQNSASSILQPTSLFLIRHGQASRPPGTGFYGAEAPLSELGRRQASALAASLASGPALDALYSSNLPRALETASVMAERMGMKVLVDSRLAEFEVDMTVETPPGCRPDLLVWHPDHAGADGETLAQFASKVREFHEQVVARHPGQRIALICHEGTIQAALHWSLGMDPRSPWQHEFNDLRNASITEIEFWPQGRMAGGAPRYFVLKRIGDVEHLGGLVTDC